MRNRVAIKRTSAGAGIERRAVHQSYLHPEDLFTRDGGGLGVWWTCVRTRPRWEKKFAVWLHQRGRMFFLPVFRRATVSGRKRRVSELPLFPGFVFVAGRLGKREFVDTGTVVYLLQPRSEREAGQLARELRSIWLGLTSGLYVEPVWNLVAGEPCRIIQGPLQGAEAKFERVGRRGRLVLQVEMMGGGIVVEVPACEVEAGG